MDNEKKYIYILAESVALNIKIHSLLESALFGVTLDPTPEGISLECGVVVKIRFQDLNAAKKILEKSNVSKVKYIAFD